MIDETLDDASSEAILVECELPEPPEKVWRALTVPEVVAAWLMPNDIAPQVGHRFAFDKGERAEPVECEIIAAEPERLLRYSWRERPSGGNSGSIGFDSTVTFVLARTASGGTHLRIVHADFAKIGSVPAMALSGGGCRLSFGMEAGAGSKHILPANAPLLLRAA